MSQGLAFDSEDGIAAAVKLCGIAKDALGSVTIDHPSAAAIFWLSAESGGAESGRSLAGKRGRADTGIVVVRVGCALDSGGRD